MIIYVDFIIWESKPFLFMRLKENDFSIGRGQQIDNSFDHFGSKRKSSLRETLSPKGIFPARNWQKEITFPTYYPFYIYVKPNKKQIHKRWPISEILQPFCFWNFPKPISLLRLFSRTLKRRAQVSIDTRKSHSQNVTLSLQNPSLWLISLFKI